MRIRNNVSEMDVRKFYNTMHYHIIDEKKKKRSFHFYLVNSYISRNMQYEKRIKALFFDVR